MWESAKKPIKIRSVLQPNGMRHFIVNEESDETYTSFLQQKRNIKSSKPPLDGNDNLGQHHHHSNRLTIRERYKPGNDSFDNNILKYGEKQGCANLCPVFGSVSLIDSGDRSLSIHDREFFGVAGSKICNSKKPKGHNSRYFHQFQHSFKENSLLQLQREMEMSRCFHSKVDSLDLIPVKSPVIKKLLTGGSTGTSSGGRDIHHNQRENSNQSSSSSTTLCSRIMTWIDLEVKRNAGKGKPSSALSFTAADLNIVNELSLPGDLSQTKFGISSPTSSVDASTSGESVISSSSCNSSTSSTLSLPKLTPCWRKEVDRSGNKVKKSVRISDDLPKWGKMKRRLRKKDRSVSLDELYDNDLTSDMTDYKNYTNCHCSSGERPKPKKSYSSDFDLSEGNQKQRGGIDDVWNHGFHFDDTDENETDSFVVCDQRLENAGKVQVHIFLPQTDSTTREISESASPRSEDSTS